MVAAIRMKYIYIARGGGGYNETSFFLARANFGSSIITGKVTNQLGRI